MSSLLVDSEYKSIRAKGMAVSIPRASPGMPPVRISVRQMSLLNKVVCTSLYDTNISPFRTAVPFWGQTT